jgi:hypothetical protein
MRSKCLLLLSMAFALPAVAAGANGTRSFESVLTLRVDGEVEIDANGGVVSHKLDTALPEEFRASIDKAVARWRFQPPTEDGKPVERVRSRMRIALAAHEAGKDFIMKIENVTFPGPRQDPAATEHPKPPRLTYSHVGPHKTMAEALVTYHIKYDAAGRVLDVWPTQCTVLTLANALNPKRACQELERHGVAAARQWRLEATPDAPDHMTGSISLHFATSQNAQRVDVPGQWRREVRSSFRSAPWLQSDVPRVGTSDVSGSGLVEQQAGVALLEGIGKTL